MLFLDLPLEILPEVLAFVVKPQHLWATCLVNSNFRAFATPRLYERISIYSWHKESKIKVRSPIADSVDSYPIWASLDRSFGFSRLSLNTNILLCSCRSLVRSFTNSISRLANLAWWGARNTRLSKVCIHSGWRGAQTCAPGLEQLHQSQSVYMDSWWILELWNTGHVEILQEFARVWIQWTQWRALRSSAAGSIHETPQTFHNYA